LEQNINQGIPVPDPLLWLSYSDTGLLKKQLFSQEAANQHYRCQDPLEQSYIAEKLCAISHTPPRRSFTSFN